MAKQQRSPYFSVIQWRDTFATTTGWFRLDNPPKITPVIAYTAGWVLPGLLPGYVAIASSYHRDHDGGMVFNDLSLIPESDVLADNEISLEDDLGISVSNDAD